MRGQKIDPERLFDLLFRQARAGQGSDRSLPSDRTREKLLSAQQFIQLPGKLSCLVNVTRVRFRDLCDRLSVVGEDPEDARILADGRLQSQFRSRAGKDGMPSARQMGWTFPFPQVIDDVLNVGWWTPRGLYAERPEGPAV